LKWSNGPFAVRHEIIGIDRKGRQGVGSGVGSERLGEVSYEAWTTDESLVGFLCPDFQGEVLGDAVEIGIAMQKKKIILDGRLGDQAIDRAADRHSLAAKIEIHPGRGMIRVEPRAEIVEALAAEIFGQQVEIPFRGGSLKDLREYKGRDAEGEPPFNHQLEFMDGIRSISAQIADQDGGVDQDHRDREAL